MLLLPLERVWDERNRARVLLVSGLIIAVVAAIDWWTKPYVSLGFLYLFPIMLAAGFLPRWVVILLGTVCAVLAEIFSSLTPSLVRLGFETLALVGCGLFVAELVRNRRLSLEAQERLNAKFPPGRRPAYSEILVLLQPAGVGAHQRRLVGQIAVQFQVRAGRVRARGVDDVVLGVDEHLERSEQPHLETTQIRACHAGIAVTVGHSDHRSVERERLR